MTTLTLSQHSAAPKARLAHWIAALLASRSRRVTARLTAEALRQLPEHQLRDIGLTRDSVAGAAAAAVRDAALRLSLY